MAASRPKAWQRHRGFIIEAFPQRGKWRIRVTKEDRSLVRKASRAGPDEVATEWISGAYMARDEAIEQVKQAIDRGGFG